MHTLTKESVALVLGAAVALSPLAAQEPVLEAPPPSRAAADAEAAAIAAYWTPERQAEAVPMPLPEVVVDASALEAGAVAVDSTPTEPPGFAPGFAPGRGPRAVTDKGFELVFDDPPARPQPRHGVLPIDPLSGPYGPFQRYTEIEPIKVYPKSVHGKLFFTLNGGNFVCSATVIHRNTLITAGHCNSDGAGTFATNRLFCPSWKNGASSRGCWSVIGSVVSGSWHVGGDPDYDYACLITAATGTAFANSIGNVVGWIGRAWNWPARQVVKTNGYPAAAPFNGGRLIVTWSPEWYEFDFTAGGQTSKLIGSDLTGGSSGGSWVLGFQKGSQEFPDTDGSAITDPGRNWVNGVNSHKRCLVSCQSPPTAVNGVFWQEMSSPPFRRTAADADESEDVIAACLASGGT